MITMMSASSATATARVDKATSDLLINPDWAMNMDICDYINSYPGQAREFVKAVKRRMQHKNSNVQFLALTLLETMVKNCGDYIHFQIADKNIPAEMVKIVKKKADMRVRDKVLGLLDSWQEAFGGPGGKHPQYYHAYDELRRSGVQFPRRSPDASPIFTPPVSHPTLRHTQPGYGMPSNSSRRLDEAMAAEIEGLSMSTINSMREVMDLLSDMLQAVNPRDRDAVKDEIIVDLVTRCQTNQKQLMQMITTTSDEELLLRALELNDKMQIVLAKHDAIASGSPFLSQITNGSPQPAETRGFNPKDKEVNMENGPSSVGTAASPSAPPVALKTSIFDEEEEEDDFAQLARRHSNSQPTSARASVGGEVSNPPPNSADLPSSFSSPSTPSSCRALVLPGPPTTVKTSKEQDMIDFLSLALTTTSTSTPQTPEAPSVNQNAGGFNGNHYDPQSYSGAQGQVSFNSYVVPWAQSQNPPQMQYQTQQQTQVQPQPQPRPHIEPQHYQPSYQQVQPQYAQPSTQRFIPPPWASTPGYLNSGSTNTLWTSHPEVGSSSSPFQETRPMKHVDSFPVRGINGPTSSGPVQVSNPSTGQKAFVPSYRLFEDLNVLGSSSASSGLSGSTGQSMIGGRR